MKSNWRCFTELNLFRHLPCQCFPWRQPQVCFLPMWPGVQGELPVSWTGAWLLPGLLPASPEQAAGCGSMLFQRRELLLGGAAGSSFSTVPVLFVFNFCWSVVDLQAVSFRCTVCCVLSCVSRVWLFVTPWTVARQAPLSLGFSRQEHWSGLPFPPPGDLSNPGIKLHLLRLLLWQAGS